jgi:diguanylate cyclase (GGDEF)-like protein
VLSRAWLGELGGRLIRATWALALLLALAALGEALPLSELAAGVHQWAPVILWPAVLILCIVLTRSRLFFLSLLTGLTWLVQSGQVPFGAAAGADGGLAGYTALLYAVGLLVLTLTAGRGIVSEPALIPWTVLLIILALAFLSGRSPQPGWIPGVKSFVSDPDVLPLPGGLSLGAAAHLLIAVALLVAAATRNRLTGGLVPAFLAAGFLSAQPELPLNASVAWTTAPILATIAILAEAYSLAYIDTLTGLPGRRAMEVYERQLGRRYAVAMVDIDHFKGFNDTYGHHAGDQVLRMVASRLASVGVGGRAFRYGGEEFAILFRHADEERISSELERLRATVEASPFTFRSATRNRSHGAGGAGRKRRGRGGGTKNVTVTVSVGMATRRPADRSVEETRGRADQALYQAKKRGRNRVVRT